MTHEKNDIRWGILGAGNIARAFANGLTLSETGTLTAIGSRSADKADRFARELDVPKAYGSYQELIDDPEIDAVYICPPHPFHLEWTVKAADAGKHVLCEKPIGMHSGEAQIMVEAATRNGVFLMEAFMYRCSAQTKRLVELIRDGAIGDVRVIRTTFSFQSAYDLDGRLLNNALGGGGILDVGCYTVSMARLIAGAAQGQPFANPTEVKACGYVGTESHCDEWSVASLKFPGDILAQCSCGVQIRQDNHATIFGTKGTIDVAEPWLCGGPKGGSTDIILTQWGNDAETITVENAPLYAAEADAFAEGIATGQAPWPAMSLDDTLGNMAVLDKWRSEVGCQYPQDVGQEQ